MSDMIIPRKHTGVYYQSDTIKDAKTWRVLVIGVLSLFAAGVFTGLMIYFLVASHWIAGKEVASFYRNFWSGLNTVVFVSVVLFFAAVTVASYMLLRLLWAWVGMKAAAYQGMIPQPAEGKEEEEAAALGDMIQNAIEQGVSKGITAAIETARQAAPLPGATQPPASGEEEAPDMARLRRQYRHLRK